MGKRKAKEPAMGTSLGDLLFQKNVKCGDAAAQNDMIAELERDNSSLQERNRLIEKQCGVLLSSNKTLLEEVRLLRAKVRDLQEKGAKLASALFNRVVQELKDGNYLCALGLLQAALIHEPENLKAKINLAVVYAELGFRDLAIEALEEVLAKDPQNTVASRNLGILVGETEQT